MEENEHEYRVDRATQYGDYVALVTVDKHTRKQHIALYKGEPFETVFFVFPLERDPIAEQTIGPHTDVNNTITKMIIDYELPYYQQAKAQATDHFLDIDYEEELKKRRPKRKKEEEEPQPQGRPETIVKDWQEDQVYILNSPKRNIHPNSLANLKQFQNLKK